MQIDLDARVSAVPANWRNDRLHFFKYMTASTAKIVLANRTLRWSTPSQLNDPFDMQFDMSINVNKEQLKATALEKMWGRYSGEEAHPVGNMVGIMLEMLRQYAPGMTKADFFAHFGPGIEEGYHRAMAALPSINAQTAPGIATMKVLSLTTMPSNNLMWTHYADAHRGVVLRLRSIPALDSPYGMAKPMNYVETFPSLLDEEDLVNMSAGIESINVTKIVDKIVYTKSAEYKYEREWRLCSGSGRDTNAPFEDIPFAWNELDGIVLGLNVSDSDRAEILALACGYPNIEMMQAKRTRSTLELGVEAI
jgi:hypothetical protein